MKYKIIKRIQSGHKTIGYQLISDDLKTVNMSKEQVIKLAFNNRITNATYNRYTKSIKSRPESHLKLSSLPVLQASTPKRNISNTNSKSNHQLAKEYELKTKLIGQSNLVYELIDDDRVVLIRIEDKKSTGKIVIPSFITDFKNSQWFGSGIFRIGPFSYCRYSHIIIDNNPYIDLDIDYLFNRIQSENLKIEFSHPECIVSMIGTFYGCSNLKSLDLSNINTSRVRNMSKLFSKCKQLQELNLSNFDTSNVINMSDMFNGCESLQKLNISSFNTPNLKSMTGMFSECKSLRSIDLTNFKTPLLESITGLFDECESLQNIKIPNLDTSKVEIMTGIFAHCKSLTHIDLSNFRTDNAKSLEAMFSDCISLQELDLSSFDTSNVTNMCYMFSECKSLLNLDLSNFNTKRLVDTAYMFENCTSLANLYIKLPNKEQLESRENMFKGCNNLRQMEYKLKYM